MTRTESPLPDPAAAALPQASRPWARLQAWSTILRIALQERLVYRGDFILQTLMRFLPIVTQIFLWQAVFSASRRDHIEGYRYGDFIAYYLLIMISRSFSSMPGLATGITQEIRDGSIKKYLIQPIDLIGYLLLRRIAHKLVYYLMAFLPFALVFYLCREYFPGWPDGATMAAFLASLVLGFLLGFFLEATLGLVGFWFLEVSSLLFIYMMLTYFLSGHMFPLDMLPDALERAVFLLPLHYLAYFPAAVFLNKLTWDEVMQGLYVEAAWVGALILASRLAFHFGVRRYSGFGG